MSPEQAPGLEYPLPGLFSFSPYVVNHKHRRGGGNSEFPDLPSAYEGGGSNFEEEVGDNFGNLKTNADDDDNEGFVDTKSEASEVGIGCFLAGKNFDSSNSVCAQGDFCDANDDFSSDGSRTESELHLTRLTILEESKGESAQRKLLLLCAPNRRCTSDEIIETENDFSKRLPLPDLLLKQLEGVRPVPKLKKLLQQSSNRRIKKLCDYGIGCTTMRLLIMNSHRGSLWVLHKQQERKIKRRWRWMWRGFVGISVAAIGASFAAYSYVPRVTDHAFNVDTGT
ncbi:hypothetical protein CASFOL_035655 [Castilleja foliolosa]|uniref:Uncharacterized protein n=1 Tax=Castilleja foliolosa TaxID=1961234 RepID=A0ABD3BTA0_9LAMI